MVEEGFTLNMESINDGYIEKLAQLLFDIVLPA